VNDGNNQLQEFKRRQEMHLDTECTRINIDKGLKLILQNVIAASQCCHFNGMSSCLQHDPLKLCVATSIKPKQKHGGDAFEEVQGKNEPTSSDSVSSPQ